MNSTIDRNGMQCGLLSKLENIGGDMLPIGRMNRRERGTLDYIDYKERSMLPPGTKAAFITEYRRVRRYASRLCLSLKLSNARTSARRVNARAEQQKSCSYEMQLIYRFSIDIARHYHGLWFQIAMMRDFIYIYMYIHTYFSIEFIHRQRILRK